MPFGPGLISRLGAGALALALMAGILANFANVLGRYIAGTTIEGVDEVEIYILIAIAFVGAAAMSARRGHLRMDVIAKTLPRQVQKLLHLAEGLIATAVCGFVAWHSFQYVSTLYDLGAVSDIARIPTFIPHALVMVAFASMAVILGVRTVLTLPHVFSPESPVQELQ